MERSNGGVRKLLRLPAPFWLRITPDGSAVAYNIHRVRSRLFLMRGVGVPKN